MKGLICFVDREPKWSRQWNM